MLGDLQKPSLSGDSVPNHPFHGESAIGGNSSPGGLLDFIDQQAPEAPDSQRITYRIRRRSGRVFGPYDETAIVQMLLKQELAGNEDTSTDGENWVPLSKIPVFAEEIQAITAASLGSLGAAPPPPGHAPPAAAATQANDSNLPGLPGVDLPGNPNVDLPGNPNIDLPGISGLDLPGLQAAGQPPPAPLGGMPSAAPAPLAPYSPDQGAPPSPPAGSTPGLADIMADIGASYSAPEDGPAGAQTDAPPEAPEGLDPLAADLSISTEERVKRGPSLGKQRRQAQKSAKTGTLLAVLALLFVVVAGGVFLGLATDYGWFGYSWVMAKLQPPEPTPEPEPPPEPKVPTTRVPVDTLLAKDSYITYMQAAQLLEPLAATSPAKAALLGSVYARLALLDGDPNAIPSGRAALTKVKGEADGEEALVATAIIELVAGGCDTARSLLEVTPKTPLPEEPDAKMSNRLAIAGLTLACGEGKSMERASAWVDRALLADPTNTLAMWCQARISRVRGDTATAAGYFEKILERDPTNIRATLLLGEILAAKPETATEATAALERASLGAKEHLAPWQQARLHLGLARLRFVAHEFEEAVEQAASALKNAGSHRSTLLQVGELALELRSFDIAKKAFQRLRKADGASQDALIGLARATASGGDTLAAYELLEKAVKKSPKSADLNYWLGWAQLQLAKEDQARKSFLRAHRLAPDQAPPVQALIALFFQRGDLEGAQKFLLKAREKASKEAQPYMDITQAEIHLRLRRFSPALASLQKAEDRGVVTAESRALQGLVLLKQRKVEQGHALIEAVHAENPMDPWRSSLLARSLLDQGKPKEALPLLEKAIKGDPQQAEYLLLTAQAHLALGDDSSALDVLKTAAELTPKNPEIYYLQGIATQEASPKKALELLKQAETMAPTIARYSLQLGRSYAEEGAFLDAIDYFRAAIRKDESDAQGHYELGRALMERGFYTNARAQLQEALRLDPGLLGAYLAIGDALAKQGDYPAALRAYMKAVKLDPKLYEAFCKIGYVQKNEGRLKQAEAALLKCLRGNPFHAEAHKSIGYVYKDMGRNAKAIHHFETHLKHNPEDPEAELVREDLATLTE